MLTELSSFVLVVMLDAALLLWLVKRPHQRPALQLVRSAERLAHTRRPRRA